MSTVFIDIETRSRADLPEVGAYRYGEDPSTEVLMMAVSEQPEDAPVHLWVNPKFESAGVASDPRAMELLAEADIVYAHNAPFELSVLQGTKTKPFVSLNKWRCTQAMARMAGIAESLEKCAEMLKLDVQKDSRGKALIRMFSIPQEDGSFIDPTSEPQAWKQFCDYCCTDVKVEKQIARVLQTFAFDNPGVLGTWQLTLRMNDAGIPVNRKALLNAQRIIREVTKDTSEEFQRLTGLKITQREKVRQWLSSHGMQLPNMQSDTLAEAIANRTLPQESRHVAELYSQLSYSAIKKVDTMLDWVCHDDRLRGVFKFYGTNTGRWSAGGPQIQNAKKPTPEMRPITKQAYQAICDGATAQELSAVYGEPLEVIASCIRHFVHVPGSMMLDADYNAIEARVACWVAGESSALDQYRKGADRYKAMAAQIFNVSVGQVTDEQRTLGKVAILGLGYGMGAEKFRTSCIDQYGLNISQDLAEQATQTFRRSHPLLTALWRELDTAIRMAVGVNAVKHVGKGKELRVFCQKHARRDYMFIRLPSGRTLAYPDCKIEAGTVGDRTGDVISYFGQIPGTTSWGRVKLYGAKAFENVCQAIAADLMSHGAQNAEQLWMQPFALIHDQALAIQLDGQSPDQFAKALHQLPSWATGLPLKAEAKLTPYYAK